MTITIPISLLFHLFLIFILIYSNVFLKSRPDRINMSSSAIHVNIINLQDERPPVTAGAEKSANTIKMEEVRKQEVKTQKTEIRSQKQEVRNKKSEDRGKKQEAKSQKVVEKAKVAEKPPPPVEKAKVAVPEPKAPPAPAPVPVKEEVKAGDRNVLPKAPPVTPATPVHSEGNKQPAPVREAKLTPAEPVVSGPVADVSDFKYDYYLNVIREKVEKRWSQPRKYTQIKQALVEFTIHRNGDIDHIAVAETSGDYYFDQTAVRAVSLANPFPQLPRGYKDETLHIRYRFIFGIQG